MTPQTTPRGRGGPDVFSLLRAVRGVEDRRPMLTDTQSEPDDRRLAIDRVGITSLRYPMHVLDKDRSVQATVATLRMTVDLPHHFKGTHMSRFVEVLAAHGGTIHVENIRDILERMCQRLESDCAHLDITFPFFLRKNAPATGAAAPVDYEVRFAATLERGEQDLVVTTVVPVTTLCPCSKAISSYGAHNQRGHATLAVRCRRPMWIEDMIRIAEESASSEIFSLLKRPDEKHVTEQAYDNPVFVEDLVRNIAQRCEADPNILWYRAEAENFESIHNHNAFALIEKKPADRVS